METRTFPTGIVALRFTQNECYTEVVDRIPEGLQVDFDRRTWVSWCGVIMPFGEADIPNREYGRQRKMIGVYDVRELKQLQALVGAVSAIAEASARGAIYVD